MSNGWVKMEKELVRSEIWHDFIGLRLYLWLVLNATNQDNVKVREITLKKGQYIRSLSSLQDDLSYVVGRGLKKVPVMTISRAIKYLESLGYIQTKVTRYGFLFTILPTHKEAYFSDERIDRTKVLQNGDELDKKVVTDKERKIERKEDDDDEKTAEQQKLAKQQAIATSFIELRNKGTYLTEADCESVRRISELPHSSQELASMMKRVFTNYQEKNTTETINSPKYMEKALQQLGFTTKEREEPDLTGLESALANLEKKLAAKGELS
jgi:predicted RNA binding protein YcfA (HicA-like mRNA interferase family)